MVINMEDEWINDATHKCSICEFIFKVYGKNIEPHPYFCPNCGSSQLDRDDD